MIQTNFEPYCEDCTDLEPVVERLYGNDGVIQQVMMSVRYSESEKRTSILKHGTLS